MMTLNLGSNHLQVPVIVGVAVILVALIPVVILAVGLAREYSRKWFVCGDCGHRFKTSVKKCLFTAHVNGEIYLKCPECGKTTMCSESYIQDESESKRQDDN